MFVLPVDENKRTSIVPYAVYGLIIANTVIFIVAIITPDYAGFFESYGFIPIQEIYHTMITSMFLHAGVFHILGNMFFLWMFGDVVEEVVGRFPFLILFLVCGILGTALHYAFNRYSTVPCIGASGAISGIIGFYMFCFPKNRITLYFFFLNSKVGVLKTSAFVAVTIWLFEQTFLGILTELIGICDLIRVAFWSHVGGLISGLLIGCLFKASEKLSKTKKKKKL